MVLERYRELGDKLLNPIARNLNIAPNLLTLFALCFAVLAGIAFYLSSFIGIMLILTSVAITLNGFFDALDGRVAKLTGRATRRGDFLEHLLDRYADICILGGILLSVWCHELIGIAGLVGVLMASYAGTQAQAVGADRIYSGLLGRADRVLILIVAPMLQFLIPQPVGWFTVLEWVMLYFFVAGNLTVVQRATLAWKRLSSEK